jgi:hypothetical protein
MVEPPAGRAGAVARPAPGPVVAAVAGPPGAVGAAGRELVASPRTWGRAAVLAGRVVVGRLEDAGGRAVVGGAAVAGGAAVVGGAVVTAGAVVTGGLVVVGWTGWAAAVPARAGHSPRAMTAPTSARSSMTNEPPGAVRQEPQHHTGRAWSVMRYMS